MSDSDVAAVQARLQMWWQSVDPATRAIFEEIYAAAPGAVISAISGGEIDTLPEGQNGLGTFLDNADGQIRVPLPTVATAITASPDPADANVALTLSWDENNGGASTPGYRSRLVITDRETQTVAYDQEFDNDALDAGATKTRTHTVANGLPAASYDISLWINTEGGDGTGVPPEAGLMSGSSGFLAVGGIDDSRPGTPFQADVTGIQGAIQNINDARNVGTQSWNDMKAYAVEALRSLAAVTNDDAQQGALIVGSNNIEQSQITAQDVSEEQAEAVSTALTEAGQAIYAFQSAPMTREYIEQYLPEAVAACQRLAQAISYRG